MNNNSIKNAIDKIRNNIFSEEIEEHKPFFFYLKFNHKDEIVLNTGSNENHLYILMTTKYLFRKIDQNFDGCFHIDATYKLIRNGFPLIVFGKTDFQHKLHPIAFCISSHEQEEDYKHFYLGIKNLACDLNLNFSPDYILQDAWYPSFNAAQNLFPDTKILMCYYHVAANWKKKYKSYSVDIQKELKIWHRKMHFSKNGSELTENLKNFKQYCNLFCPEFKSYVIDVWLKSNYIHLEIFWI